MFTDYVVENRQVRSVAGSIERVYCNYMAFKRSQEVRGVRTNGKNKSADGHCAWSRDFWRS